MRTTILIVLLVTSFIANSQKAPDSSLTLDSKIVDLYLHNTTGISVATTNGGVYGIDGEKGEKIWEFKETGFVKSLNQLGQDGGSSFEEIPSSPFGRFNQTIFNIKTGNKIISSDKNNFKKIIDNKYVIGKKAILFTAQTAEKTKAKLFLISLLDDSLIWEKTIETDKKISGGSLLTNYTQNNSKLAFSLSESIFLVNKNDGNIILSKKYNSGKLFFTEDNKSLIAVENKGGSMIGGAIKAGMTMGLSLIGKKIIGKELYAFDTNSGKEVWKKPIKLNEGFVDYQFVDNKLFVINKDGGSLFDYNSGEEIWKKEFSKKKIKNLEKDSKGYMVYFKNKKHLVDNTGKKIWKKAERVIKNVDFEVGDEEEFTSFNYASGTLFLTPYRIEYFEKGNEKKIYKIALNDKIDKLAYDEINKNLILLKDKKLYILNPDKKLGKEEVKKIDFNDASTVNSIEIREKGYFINSNWEYIITDFSGNTLKKKYYKQPGEGVRHLKNFGSAVFAVGSAKVHSETDPTTGKTAVSLSSSAAIVDNQNAKGTYVSKHGEDYEALSNLLYTPERYNAFKSTKNSAFFFTKKDDKKVLLQVNKDSGEVIENYEFAVDKPKYIVDKIEKRIFFRKGKDLKIFSYN